MFVNCAYHRLEQLLLFESRSESWVTRPAPPLAQGPGAGLINAAVRWGGGVPALETFCVTFYSFGSPFAMLIGEPGEPLGGVEERLAQHCLDNLPNEAGT